MAELQTSYSFFPWLRRGLSTEIIRMDGASGSPAPRAELDISLGIDDRGKTVVATRAATTRLALYGPGEIAGIDSRMIVATHPKRGDHDVEPNYFPHIEFDQPDFPWRYTPARASINGRLRPWFF